MADELFTRCPGCKTIFRVTEPQLALRAGPGPMRPLPHRVQRARGADRARRAGARRARPERRARRGPADGHAAQRARARSAAAAADGRRAGAGAAAGLRCRLREPLRVGDEARALAVRAKVLGAIAIPLLAVALVLQAVFHFRDALAAHMPATKPALHARLRGRRLRDPAVARRGGAVDRRLRPASRPRAQGPARS